MKCILCQDLIVKMFSHTKWIFRLKVCKIFYVNCYFKENNIDKNDNHMAYLVLGAIETMPTTAFALHVLFGLALFAGQAAHRFGCFGVAQIELNLCEQTDVETLQKS
jgi:hypothetical protein